MAERNLLLVGQIAIEWGLVTKEQLAQCLDEQSGQKPVRPIGVLLVAKGYLTENQLVRLIDEQRRRMGEPAEYAEVRKQDILFGRLLIRTGWVTADDVHEALRGQQDLAERGVNKRLGEILVDCGRLTAEAVRATLAAQGKKLMACPSCGTTFNVVQYVGGRRYKCKKCGMELDIATETLSADETAYPKDEMPPDRPGS